MSSFRAIKFAILTHAVAPLALRVLSLLTRTWKYPADLEQTAREELGKGPLILVCHHGSVLAMAPIARLCRKLGRPVCALSSPSKDGLLMDLALRMFGIEVVKGSSKSKAAAGARGMIESIAKGNVGFIAIDGPRGPIGIPKSGVFRMAESTGARILCISPNASKYIQFRKAWDRMFLPHPFATITLAMRVYEPGNLPDEEQVLPLARLQAQLAKEVDSPLLPHLPPEVRS